MNETNQNEVQAEMPKYQCQKVVHALKIKSIVMETDGSATITPEEEGYAPFKIDYDYVRRHNPNAGGYYVVYEDGYKSWSPAGAFEKGYSLIIGSLQRDSGEVK